MAVAAVATLSAKLIMVWVPIGGAPFLPPFWHLRNTRAVL
jgi:hypothetical protein